MICWTWSRRTRCRPHDKEDDNNGDHGDNFKVTLDWFFNASPLSDVVDNDSQCRFVNGTSYNTWRLPVSVLVRLRRHCAACRL